MEAINTNDEETEMATREYSAADLRAWRARARLTQTAAAQLFMVAQTTYSLWERGQVPKDFSDRFEAVLLNWYETHLKPG